VDTQKCSETRIGKRHIKGAVQQYLTRIEAYDNQLPQIFKEAGIPVRCTCQLRVLSLVGGETAALEADSTIDTWRPYLMGQASHYKILASIATWRELSHVLV
jgi:hypothetical protein